MEELFNGAKVIEEFEAMTKDAERVQRETLKKILEENESAEYLSNLNLNGRTDPKSFKTCVPVVSHEDIEPYIIRIANNEDNSNILTAKPFNSITISSGTTQETGSMEPYLKKLRHYVADKLPLLNTNYGSSEGWIGVFIDPNSPPEMATYVVPPNVCYFEFIPQTLKEINSDKHEQIESNTVGLTEVKVGEEYEILITSFAGLYRYRLGDVVKVMGFHNSTPKIKFISRKNVLLNITIDKTTEKDLQIAVEEASKLLPDFKLEVIDFTSYADLSTTPGHYVFFWELSYDYEKANYDEILGECCNCMDKSLVDYGYTLGRNSKNIGPLELCIVKSGTFQKIQDHTVASGASISQFKSPRCVSSTNHGVLEILYNNVVKSYHSTAF